LVAQTIQHNRPGFHPGTILALKLHLNLADQARLELDHALARGTHKVMVFAGVSCVKPFLPPFFMEDSRADQVFLF
jgi:hypothetical protein